MTDNAVIRGPKPAGASTFAHPQDPGHRDIARSPDLQGRLDHAVDGFYRMSMRAGLPLALAGVGFAGSACRCSLVVANRSSGAAGVGRRGAVLIYLMAGITGLVLVTLRCCCFAQADYALSPGRIDCRSCVQCFG